MANIPADELPPTPPQGEVTLDGRFNSITPENFAKVEALCAELAPLVGTRVRTTFFNIQSE